MQRLCLKKKKKNTESGPVSNKIYRRCAVRDRLGIVVKTTGMNYTMQNLCLRYTEERGAFLSYHHPFHFLTRAHHHSSKATFCLLSPLASDCFPLLLIVSGGGKPESPEWLVAVTNCSKTQTDASSAAKLPVVYTRALETRQRTYSVACPPPSLRYLVIKHKREETLDES